MGAAEARNVRARQERRRDDFLKREKYGRGEKAKQKGGTQIMLCRVHVNMYVNVNVNASDVYSTSTSSFPSITHPKILCAFSIFIFTHKI